jgi:hypothetical protein
VINDFTTMKTSKFQSIIASAALVLVAFATKVYSATLSASNTYETVIGTVHLVAGLTTLSSSSAINPADPAGLNYITDNLYSTGINNMGRIGNDHSVGTLAGTFDGSNYFSGSNQIILIGFGDASQTFWGSWSVRLLLSNNTYSNIASYTDADLVINADVLVPSMDTYNSINGRYFYNAANVPTCYQILDISTFDTQNIGVKGIELSNLGAEYPELSYIGVTGVPEPSSLVLTMLASGVMLIRRRR